MSREVAELVAGISAGDRRALARAITLIESTRDEDLVAAQQIIQELAPRTGSALRIGITGIPGVGKSTFIDVFGTMLTERGKKVAVLAIDPSSSLSGGSILGDKTRMGKLSHDPNAFVRPSPGGEAVGGVARHTREAMLLCEATGFDVVLVETIGIGQSEVAVADMVDTFVLLLLAGAGDELQGIKRGVMELADIVVVNKADGDNTHPAELAAREYANALHLLPNRHQDWNPPALTCSALDGTGIAELFEQIEAHCKTLGPAGIAVQRRDQSLRWFDQTLREMLVRKFLANTDIAATREQVRAGTLQPTAAVLKLLG